MEFCRWNFILIIFIESLLVQWIILSRVFMFWVFRGQDLGCGLKLGIFQVFFEDRMQGRETKL